MSGVLILQPPPHEKCYKEMWAMHEDAALCLWHFLEPHIRMGALT